MIDAPRHQSPFSRVGIGEILDEIAGIQDARHEAMQLIADRAPCGRCGVRKDVHVDHGCRRWRA